LIVGLVCARAGSKGVPGKNFRKFCGKPLIDWSIEQAVNAEKLDAVAIITDAAFMHSDVYLTLQEPRWLAGDFVAKWRVWQWAANELDGLGDDILAIVDIDVSDGLGDDILAIVDIDVSRPIREPEHIDRVISRFLAPPPDCHITMGVTRAKYSPYFDLLENGAGLRISKPSRRFTVRQEFEQPVYNHAGVYVISKGALQQFGSLFEPSQIVHGVKLPRENAISIDDELDWEMAEAVMGRRVFKKEVEEAVVAHRGKE
jgi:N-acylneuraminate cytidylyltransferase